MFYFYHLYLLVKMKKIKFQIEYVKNFLLSKNIILLDNEYINHSTPLNYQCKICNHIWKNCFNNIKNSNQGCPKCSRKRVSENQKIPINDVISLFNDKNITLLDTIYVNAKSPLNCKCKICNHIWKITQSNVKANRGCPNCKKITISKQKRLSDGDVKKYLLDKNIELLSIYITSTTPIICKCKICNYTWKSSGLNYIKNHNAVCQNCNNRKNSSENICRYIFETIFQKKFIKMRIPVLGIGGGPLELDGYCEELKIAFEHNGIQHFQPKNYGKSNTENVFKKFKTQKENDKIKKEWCTKNNITLININQLWKETTEENIKDIIKNQCIHINLPKNFETLQFNFKEIKNKIFPNIIMD